MTQAERRLFLIRSLMNEKTEYADLGVPRDADGQRQLLRGLINVRLPAPADGMQIEEEIARQVDAVICAGATRCGEASTIVDCTRETPYIVRVGAVPPEEILSVWKNA